MENPNMTSCAPTVRDGSPGCYGINGKAAGFGPEMLAHLFENSHERFFILDGLGCVMAASSPALRSGAPPDRQLSIGQSWLEFIRPKWIDAARAALASVLAGSLSETVDCWEHERIVLSPLRASGNEVGAIFAFWRNLGEDADGTRRAGTAAEGPSDLKVELAQAKKELEDLRLSLERSERLSVLGEYVTATVHDLNNVLAGASSALRLVGRAAGPGPLSGIAGEGMDVLERGARLVRQMLEFARGSGEDMSPLSVSQVVGDISGLIRSLAGPAIVVEITAPSDVWPILSSAGRVESVLLNLTVNARDAMPKGGRLFISVANSTAPELPRDMPPGDYVRLQFADTGEGMTPETLAKAGQPFFTTKRHGTGLGLAGAFKLVASTGGRCVVASTFGAGSVITLFMARSEAGFASR